MHAILAQVHINITLPEGSPKRESFTISVNTTHRTWSLVNGAWPAYLCQANTDYINKLVDSACRFAATIEGFTS